MEYKFNIVKGSTLTTGSNVQANVTNDPTEVLENLKVDEIVYDVPSTKIKVSDLEDPSATLIKTISLNDDKYSLLGDPVINRLDVSIDDSATNWTFDGTTAKKIFNSTKEFYTNVLPYAVEITPSNSEGLFGTFVLDNAYKGAYYHYGITSYVIMNESSFTIKNYYINIRVATFEGSAGIELTVIDPNTMAPINITEQPHWISISYYSVKEV